MTTWFQCSECGMYFQPGSIDVTRGNRCPHCGEPAEFIKVLKKDLKENYSNTTANWFVRGGNNSLSKLSGSSSNYGESLLKIRKYILENQKKFIFNSKK